MSENSESKSGGKTPIRDTLIDILFEALNDAAQGVRTGVLRLLVRLPLPDAYWFRLAMHVEQQLEQYLPPEAEAQARFSFESLLDAATRIPVSTVRRALYEYLREGSPQALRQQVVRALAQARDVEVIDLLLSNLINPEDLNPQEAAYWLAHYDRYHLIEDLKNLADNHPDPIVRFWLSVGLLRHGEYQYFTDLLHRHVEGDVELPVLWGNPMDLAQQIMDCGPFPGDFLDFLIGIQNEEENPLIGELIDAYQSRAAVWPPTTEPAQPSAPWDGNIVELARQLIEHAEDEVSTLQQLFPAQKTSLISACFDELEKRTAWDGKPEERPFYTGIGNPIVQLPWWFWRGFDPDQTQLFDISLRLAPERTDLLQQLAWVVSRAGKTHVLEEFLPLLPMLEAKEKIALLQLLEHAVLFADQNFGPIFGAGVSTSESIPVIRHFIDYKSAAEGGGEQPSMTMDGGKVTPRYVQGEVQDVSDEQAPEKLEQAFLAGKKHELKVWIGELQEGFIAAPAPIDLESLPDLPNWELQVYFWEPNHAPEMQIGSLTIYQDQLPDLPVSTCKFTFTPRADLPEFQGRLAVVYQNNVLQMLFLEGKVVAEADSAAEDERIRFQWAEVKGLGNPDQLEKFDLVFYNETDPVQGNGLSFFGGQAGLKRISGLDQGIQDIISALQEAGMPGTDPLAARSGELVILANLGRMLYDAIIEQLGADGQSPLRLQDAQRLQLVSAVRDVFPLEMVYVFPAPDPDAALCPNAEQAILTGRCATCEALEAADATRVVCPLGFLGMRCLIERHAIQPLQQTDAVRAGSDYLLRVGLTAGAKTISPLKASLCAASAKVAGSSRQQLTTSLRDSLTDAYDFADTWTEWKSKVKDQTILILIPHTLKDRGIPSLEIGDSKLWKTSINASVVPASQGAGPLVLLIGCETAVPEAPYQAFAAEFARQGAAITVMTLSPVHESRAVPITEMLVKQLADSALRQQTFSEALLQTRRTAMAAGYAEVLTLVADGDADWVLT